MFKTTLRHKLIILIKILFIFLLINVKSYADNQKIVIGSDDAPIKIKIFSSLTCPHCANFHIKVIPEIEKNYVKSGKVQLILIDFPLDQVAFNASKLLHCLDAKKQIKFLDTLYENQDQWASGSDVNEINNNLKKTVETFGISSAQFDKCIDDETVGDRILSGRIDGQQKYSIDSTPTIVINDKKLKGSASFKNIKKKIEKLI